MIPLLQLPHIYFKAILRKLDGKSWVRLRQTCKFIHKFVKKNEFLFCVPSPKPILSFYIDQKLKLQICVFSSEGSPESPPCPIIRGNIEDPLKQLMGFSFQQIEFHNMHVGPHLPSKKHNAILKKILKLISSLNLRPEWLLTHAHPSHVYKLLLTTGCKKIIANVLFFTEDANLLLSSNISQQLTHIRFPFLFEMEALPILAGNFSHLEFKWERNDHTMGDDIHSHINTFLREIMARKVESEQTVSICYKDDLRSANIMGELENIPVTTVFDSNNFRRDTGEKSRILVVMKETEEKKMAVFTSYCTEINDFRELHLRVAPTWTPIDYVDFILERAISTQPIDMSSLYEGLENSDKHADTIESFLNHCYI